ncbi:peptide deformylase [Thiotrichales bacterium 19S3-7]|nr:peptide deformylase [Thiotrichales bacterium 19S3-7]MCF6802338.1 peptide deformylase [Thiotrichales bacterium 19S3-11]
MALLEVLKYPNPFLKKKVDEVNLENVENYADTIANMIETMYHTRGIGLAATQVGINARIFVMDLSEDRSKAMCFINPEIIETHGSVLFEEGCLSFPGMFVKVDRAEKIKVKAYDQTGKAFELEADGLQGICIQHETDHLNGITFFDHLSPLKRKLAEKKFSKLRKITT